MKQEHKDWLFRSFAKEFPTYKNSDNIKQVFYQPESIKKWLEKWIAEYEQELIDQ